MHVNAAPKFNDEAFVEIRFIVASGIFPNYTRYAAQHLLSTVNLDTSSSVRLGPKNVWYRALPICGLNVPAEREPGKFKLGRYFLKIFA
jgi:hypothetical protein